MIVHYTHLLLSLLTMMNSISTYMLRTVISFINPTEEAFICALTCTKFRNTVRTVFPEELRTKMYVAVSSIKHLEWAHENGCSWDNNICEIAAKRGCLDVIKHANDNGYQLSKATCFYAVEGGQLEVFQWCHGNDFFWIATICNIAASGGYLEILKWAHANGYPLGEYTCLYAEENGHFEVVQWAIANGCHRIIVDIVIA